jgi:peptidyl-prolyl cis-trans isomerase SurA
MSNETAGPVRLLQGMTLPMKRIVTGSAARSAAAAAALLAAGSPLAALAQAPQTQAPAPAAPQFAAPAPAAPAQPQGISESVAAVVNDDIISTYDLAQRMRLLIATSGVQPTEQTLPQFQREALISLVDERLQFQELRRVEKEQKIDIVATDDEVNEDITQLAQQNNMTREQFEAFLASRGISPDTLREQIRANISWQRWIRGRYGSRLRVGDDQIAATEARLKAAAAKPQYQISEVFIDANRVGGMPQATQGAQQLVTQMQQGAPFPAVARQFSAAPTAATGGDAGWVSQGDLPAEVETVLAQMRPGQLSQPIPVRDGVYIIFLRDKRAGGAAELVNLKQAAVPLAQGATPTDEQAAREKLAALRPQITNCQTLEAAAAKVTGVVAGDLGEAELADLAPQFRQAAEALQVGQVSEPIRTAAGMHLVAVCGRRSAAEQAVNREQIENRLFGQQLSMIARRYMRDLRNSATIETR